ncbi:MAG: response regulator [Alphaproteobacteria bacterium]|nr:response regulator [Alphaproteobacteria bacterium]
MKKILLVDDSEADHFLSESLIEVFDPSVTIFKTYHGKEALEFLKTNFKPDLILLDLNMPLMNGLQFLENYSYTRQRNAPVVILTSSELNTDKADALKFEAVKLFITKPLSLDKLRQINGVINAD